ncbi:MAG: hypothetical protein AAFR05_23255, partial [Bacteroidota bacterium]
MKLDVIKLDAKKAGSVDLDDAIFGLEPRADILHRVVALPADDAVQDVGARLKVEDLVGDIDRSGFLAVEFDHVEFHSSPSFFSAASASATASVVSASAASIAACSASAAAF